MEGDSPPPFSKASSSEWGVHAAFVSVVVVFWLEPREGLGLRHDSVAQPVRSVPAQGCLQNPDSLYPYFSTIWNLSVFIMILKSLLLLRFLLLWKLIKLLRFDS